MNESSLPTLLRKGFIVPPKGTSERDKDIIANIRSIDYILNFLEPRIPRSKTMQPRVAPKTFGDKVLIIKASTGAGKSTVIPSFLYKTFFDRAHKNIAITQPRIMLAVDIPTTMTDYEKDLELDKNIGYTTGNFKRPPKNKGILFCTVGIITQQLIMNTAEEFMDSYQFVMIDEVHERSIENDLCLFLLKKLLVENYKNPACPTILLMSATFDEKIFIRYFEVPKENYIQVIGSTFPIENNYPKYSIRNYVQYAIKKAQKLHLDNLNDIAQGSKFRDIIIFIKDTGTGKKIWDELMIFNSQILTKSYDEIQTYNKQLDIVIESHYKTGGSESDEITIDTKKKYYVLPILINKQNFEAGGLEYQNLFSNIDMINVPLWKVIDGKIDIETRPYTYVKPTRRIIIATNVAEAGVTIDSLKYCIDTGYSFNVEFQPNAGCNLMVSKNITKGSATQRKGRVGRKSPGFWYPCYTEETFNNLPENKFSDIITIDTTENLLGILIKDKKVEMAEELNITRIREPEENDLIQIHEMADNTWYYLKNTLPTNISTLDFIELPSMTTLSYSIEKLNVLGFIDDEYDITTVGLYANQLRKIPLESRRMIFAGYFHGASISDLITIAAFLYVQKRNIYDKKFEMKNFLKNANTVEFEFYNKILIADDFVNCIFVWNIIANFTRSKLKRLTKQDFANIPEKYKISGELPDYIEKKILYMDEIKEWCEEMGLKFDGVLAVIAMRDEIIENMVTIGLDPYKNSLELIKSDYNLNNILNKSLSEGLEEVKKIKLCVFEGFKTNLLRYNTNSKQYISIFKNVAVKVKSPYIKELNEKVAEQNKPYYLIVSSYTMSQKFGSAIFEFVADSFVSVIDNFISVDNNLFLY